MERSLPCACCSIEVKLSRKRLRDLARKKRNPLCEQCRRFVSPATARVSQPLGETRDISMAVARKQGPNAKQVRPLASMPVKRCV